MRGSRIYPSCNSFLPCLASLIFVCASVAQAQTWQALPFPTDSDWPGSHGQTAVVTPSEIVLMGQPVRTVQSYSGPLTISFDTFLSQKTANDGFLLLTFIPTGIPSNLSPIPGTWLDWQYGPSGSGPDELVFQQATTSARTTVWSAPFALTLGLTNHFAMTVGNAGQLTLSVNGTPFALPSSTDVPFSQYQIELDGWQPANTWHVLNFTAVPEPGTMALVGMGLLVAICRARQSRRTG
jgi:hypothetical protein